MIRKAEARRAKVTARVKQATQLDDLGNEASPATASSTTSGRRQLRSLRRFVNGTLPHTSSIVLRDQRHIEMSLTR